MRIPKHPQHAQFDEVLAEIFDVKDNALPWNLLVMRILKLSLILEIDEELTEIFKVKGKAQFPEQQ